MKEDTVFADIGSVIATVQFTGRSRKLVLREVKTLFRFTFEEVSSTGLSWLSGRDHRILRSR
jgi:hypothetical protein